MDKTIEASFFRTKYVRRYLNDMGTLINCSAGVNEKVKFEIDIQEKQSVYDCYYFKSKYFFFFCEKYCESF